jgi:H+/Cl- antiporter ClcA
MKHNHFSELRLSAVYLIKWTLLSFGVAVLAGIASSVFLYLLEWATQTRITHPSLLYGLPFAGFAVAWAYLKWGQSIEGGNNLLIDEIHLPKNKIQFRMVPMILLSTVGSHLFGASVGREGTAVQMGGALADQISGIFKLQPEDRTVLLMAGISAGFASVFGTPLAGAIFGLEVLAIGLIRYNAIFPCIFAAILANQVGLFLGVHHTHYSVTTIPLFSTWTLLVTMTAGAIFGVTGKCFAVCTHALSNFMKKQFTYAPFRPLVGGFVVASIALMFNVDQYIGLGIPTIVNSFQQPLPAYDFAAKMMLAIASIGSGFKGGEVTPLFFIGATLGNALAPVFDMPFAFLAGIGFVAVFAGASNTPIASFVMAIELFGAEIGVFAAVACCVSYLFSGHLSIYKSQKMGTPKVQHPKK